MDIESFWNQSFLSALTRLPADQAMDEATKATELCIAYWQSKSDETTIDGKGLWQHQPVGGVPEAIATLQISRQGNVRFLVSSSSEAQKPQGA